MSGLMGTNDSFNTGQLQSLFTQGTTDTDQFQLLSPIRDTSSVSEQSAPAAKTLYKAVAARPALPTPTLNPHTDGGGALAVYHILKNFPEQVLMGSNSLPTSDDEKTTDDETGEEESGLGAVTEEQLAQLGDGDPAVGRAKLFFALLHPDSGSDSDTQSLANQVLESSGQSPDSVLNQTLASFADTTYQNTAENNFQTALTQTGLPQDQQKQVMFAYYVPSATSSLSPDLQTTLKNLQSSTASNTEAQDGLPAGTIQSPDPQKMIGNIANQFEGKVLSGLSQMLADGKINRSQYNEMRTMLYFPGAQTPNSNQLKPLLSSVAQPAANNLQSAFGFPDQFHPAADPKGYTAILAGAYATEFNKNLSIASKDLTDDEVSKLKAALSSPEAAAALPDKLKTIFAQLKAASIKNVSATYSLPSGWEPDVQMTATFATNSQSPKYQTAQGLIDQLNEWVGNTAKLTAPATPTAKNSGSFLTANLENAIASNNETKAGLATANTQLSSAQNISTSGFNDISSYLDSAGQAVARSGPASQVMISSYMKSCSLALATSQEMLFNLSIVNSNVSNKLSQIQNDAQIANLKQQASQIQECMAKEKKMDSLGPLKAIFMWIIMIILIMMLGPIGIAIMLNTLAQAKFNPANVDVAQALAQTAQAIGNKIGGPVGQLIARIATIFSLIALILVCPAAFFIDMMFGQAEFITQILEAFGIPDDIAQKIAMGFQVLFQLLAMVAISIITGGSGTEMVALNFAKSCGQIALTVPKLLETAGDAVLSALKFVYDGLKYIAQVIDTFLKSIGVNTDLLAATGADVAVTSAAGDVSTITENTFTSFVKHIAEFLENFIKATEKAMEELEAAESAVEEALDDLKSAGEEVTKATKALNSAKTASASPEVIQQLQTALDKAVTGEEEATKVLEEAMEQLAKAQELPKKMISGLMITAENLPGIVQQSVNVNNNILQAEIVKIKGDMDAATILVNQFVDQTKSILSKLSDDATSITDEIKKLGDMINDMFNEASQTVEAIFSSSAQAA